MGQTSGAAGWWLLSLGLAVALPNLGCEVPRTGYDAQGDNPLGPSFWIVPTPSDDDSLLTRSFTRPPDGAYTLEEQSVPNPCAEYLAPLREAHMGNHYEDAIDTNSTGRGGALLSQYGFGAESKSATHLLYKISTSRKLTRYDTSDYVACCKHESCGWGYVQSLVFGEGEYAAGAEVSRSVQGNYSLVHAGLSRSFKVTSTKAIKGYIAAVLVAHDRSNAVRACDAGSLWAETECVSRTSLAEAELLCRQGDPDATSPFWAEDQDAQERFRRRRLEACQWLALHGGPVVVVPEQAAPPPAPSPEPGPYVGTSTFWSGKLDLKADGSVERDDGKRGIWLFDGKQLTLKWESGFPDELHVVGPGFYSGGKLGMKLQRVR